MIRTLPLLAVAVVLAGCASRDPCLRDTAYQQATSLPPAVGVDGLKLPESASALRIPPAPQSSADLPEGQCLQTPPRMPAAPPEKAAEKVVDKPAPAAPTEAPPPPAGTDAK